VIAPLLKDARSIRRAQARRESGARDARRSASAQSSGWVIISSYRNIGSTTSEGIALLSLAEAFLRVPDPETADQLIADKLGDAD
jgi:RHH-type proline utilization regulon transcriptional repressor/proline dehydrogenase/delta 1-pyrroline-5-carboxylate dehydrogenase